MLVHETIQPGEVVFVVDDFGLWILVGCELNEILGLLLAEFYTGGLQVTLHLLDLDVALVLGVEQPEGSEDGLRLIGFELLLL